MSFVVEREVPAPPLGTGGSRELCDYIVQCVRRSLGGRLEGLVELARGDHPGFMAVVRGGDVDLELLVMLAGDAVRYRVVATPRGPPARAEKAAMRLARLVEGALVNYAETQGRGSIYFVYVPGRELIPPRAESGPRRLLQRLFLGNMIFLFAVSIAISYIFFLALGPAYTPIALTLFQVPLVLLSHKITSLLMGDWPIGPDSGVVYIVGIRVPLDRYRSLLVDVFYPRRYEIKRAIYERAIAGRSEPDLGAIREVLGEYGVVDGYEVEVKRYDIFSIVSETASRFGLPTPRVYLSNVVVPNAAASGPFRRASSMIVTTGLLARLEENEVRAVVGHELSHVRNRDVLTFFALSSLEYLSRAYILLGLYPLLGTPLGFLYLYVSLTVLFVVAKFVEARADLEAAVRLGAPDSLARALRKIGYRRLLAESSPHGRLMAWLSWNPHPPLSYRVERLAGLAPGRVGNLWVEAVRGCLGDMWRTVAELL